MDFNGEIKHRNKLSKCFITFPQSGDICSKERLLAQFQEDFKLQKFLIVQEPHSDGGVHLHAIFWFDKESQPSKAQILHSAQKHFPNDYKRYDVRSVKKEKAAIQYLTDPVKNKEVDPNPLSDFELPAKECQKIKRAVNNYRKFLLPEETEEDVKNFENELVGRCGCKICNDKILFQKVQKPNQQINIDELIIA